MVTTRPTGAVKSMIIWTELEMAALLFPTASVHRTRIAFIAYVFSSSRKEVTDRADVVQEVPEFTVYCHVGASTGIVFRVTTLPRFDVVVEEGNVTTIPMGPVVSNTIAALFATMGLTIPLVSVLFTCIA